MVKQLTLNIEKNENIINKKLKGYNLLSPVDSLIYVTKKHLISLSFFFFLTGFMKFKII